jgi:hypothetical protein
VSYAELKGRPSAKIYQIKNVEAWFDNHQFAIDAEEQEFVRKGNDVITLVSKPKSPLALLSEKCELLIAWSLFRSQPREGQASSQTTLYFSNRGLEAFVTFVIITVGLLLLLGPMWSLQFIQNNIQRLGLITAAIVLFTGLLASATIAKPFEVLAATAA